MSSNNTKEKLKGPVPFQLKLVIEVWTSKKVRSTFLHLSLLLQMMDCEWFQHLDRVLSPYFGEHILLYTKETVWVFLVVP